MKTGIWADNRLGGTDAGNQKAGNGGDTHPIHLCLRCLYLFVYLTAVLGLHCGAQALHCFARAVSSGGAQASCRGGLSCHGGLSCCGAQGLGGSGFSSCGSWALEHELWLLCSVWDLTSGARD